MELELTWVENDISDSRLSTSMLLMSTGFGSSETDSVRGRISVSSVLDKASGSSTRATIPCIVDMWCARPREDLHTLKQPWHVQRNCPKYIQRCIFIF